MPIGFTFDQVEPSGKFTGNFSFGPMTGKVSSTGKVTFTATVDELRFKGSGLLSATGRFLTGTFTLTLPDNRKDFATFEVFRTDNLTSAFAGRPASPSTQAAGPDDLSPAYKGSLHSRTTARNENVTIDLLIAEVQPDGRFAGQLAAVPIQGRLSSKGRISFSGEISDEAGNRFSIKASAHLSSGGRFLLGVLTQKIRSADGQRVSGDATFRLERSN